MENQISMLPQPTARPAGGVMRALSEVSESENNARSAMPPPPSTTGLKRQGSNLPEPAQKRKTLVERAGEPSNAYSTTSRPASAAGQNAPAAQSLRRSGSTSSSISRSTSLSSRTTSNSSYSGSLNSGIRPPTINSGASTIRPKSAYGNRGFGAAARPDTSLKNLQTSHEMYATKSKKPSLPNLRGPKTPESLLAVMPHPTRPSSMLNLRNASPKRLPSVVIRMRDRNREVSLSTQLERLRLGEPHPSDIAKQPATPSKSKSPSKIPQALTPRQTTTPAALATPRTLRHKSSMKPKRYLTADTLIENIDPDERYNDFKRMFEDYARESEAKMNKIDSTREENKMYRANIEKLEQVKDSQTESIILLKTENGSLQFQLEAAEADKKVLKVLNEELLQELRQDHRVQLDNIRQGQRNEIERLKIEHKQELHEAKQRHLEEVEQERSQRLKALGQVSTQGALEKQRHQMELDRKEQEIASSKLDIQRLEAALEREKQMNNDLRNTLKTAGENASSMESTRQGLQAKIAYLESDSKSQSEAYAAMERQMTEAIQKSDALEEKLRKEESYRRRLHNQIQELKGNIRVFCRVRPSLAADDELAKMKFPEPEESTDIEVRGADEKNSLGKDTTKTHPFTFDKVFDPHHTNDHVFEEISQLVQSALDGFNVCIFAYGQTGSGKTYTMSSEDGMIPRVLRQIYSSSKELADRGWQYKMEGSFVEVYNEEIRDLLGEDDKGNKKHEVHHDMINQETTITNTTTLSLDSKEQVESILSQAMARRSVAATKANEHSSRSHSVFILKLVGKNIVTGEESKGTLNLVDLAGSERMKNAETSGQRLKETQSINKSLSCLGDVIGALGQQGAGASGGDVRSSLTNTRDSSALALNSTAHIPYRNSKLTYLLQLSLGGNCKTLMFVMVAPEKKCLSETITSLKFAEKVSRTRIGVAKKTK